MELTKTKLKLQVIREVTGRIFIGTILLIGFIAPYSHIFFNNTGLNGWFGFSTMEGFLYSAGFPFFIVVLSILLRYASDQMFDELKKAYVWFSNLSAFTGFYFLIWCINPYVSKDFHPAVYYGAMGVVSIGFSFAISFLRSYIGKLKSIIRYLVDRIVIDGKKHAKNEREYIEEVIIPTVQRLDEYRATTKVKV